jgi:hypothetical protein
MSLFLKKTLPIIALLFVVACTSKVTEENDADVNNEVLKSDSVAERIIEQSVKAHGSDNLIGKTLNFKFRDIKYTSYKDDSRYIYTRSWESDTTGYVQDSLVNSTDFSRYINGELQTISEDWQIRYGNSINSVLYFTLLPQGLQDEAARKTYLGTDSLKGQNYHKIKVTFAQDGGGEDHDDIYCYWINSSSYLIDYLGYEFSTNGGGTRFRVAIDRQKIGDIVFQNYINYKAKDETVSILKHDQLFEKDSIVELSRIINADLSLE